MPKRDLPTGIIARGSRLYVRYRDPVGGLWKTKATGLPLSDVNRAMLIRDFLAGAGKSVGAYPAKRRARQQPEERPGARNAPPPGQGELPPARPGMADWMPSDTEIAQALTRIGGPLPARRAPALTTVTNSVASVTAVTNVTSFVTSPVTSVTERGGGDMLRVTIELVPSWGGPPKVLETMTVANDGTGSIESGNYNVHLDATHRRVEGFPRLRLGALELVYQALDVLVGGESKKRGRG